MLDGYGPGETVATRAARIATDIVTVGAVPKMKWFLLNLGANDVVTLPAEATWKTDLATILDAVNAQWPTAKVYIMRPWRRGYAAECDALASWIDGVLATRGAWAFVGPDERTFLENGDDGASYTTDGVHPNTAGYALTADQWRAVLGY